MPSERDKAKRWQFGTRELFLLMVLVGTPIALFKIAFQVYSIPLGMIAVVMGGGVIGSLFFWGLTGERVGFQVGYYIGAFLTLIATAGAVGLIPW